MREPSTDMTAGRLPQRGWLPQSIAAVARRALRHYEGRLFFDHWFIALRDRSPVELPSSMDGFRVLSPPRDRFYADPFLVEWRGHHYIFFEEFILDRGRGRIAYVEVRADGTFGEPGVALDREFHLAYPFVFKSDDALWMIPETSAVGAVELYKAPSFPGSFRFERVLLSDVSASDPTLVSHQGRFWLFMSEFGSESNPSSRLHASISRLSAYWSNTLTGQWTPHEQNPIVDDISSARPAGRLFSAGDRLIRPAQDCSRRYGYEVVLNHVQDLTPGMFVEREVGRISAGWLPGNQGTHHYDRDSAYEVVDGRWYTSTHRWIDFTFKALSHIIDGPGASSIRSRAAWSVPTMPARSRR